MFPNIVYGNPPELVVGGDTLPYDSPGRYSAVNVGGFCTGTIIADNVIVTAAHCLAQSSGPVQIFFTNTVYNVNTANTRISYEYNTHPKYRRFNDIAWMKFEGGLPEGYKPIPILSREAMDKLGYGFPIKIVGFGAPSENLPPSGEKLSADSIFNRNYDSFWYKGFFVTGPTPGKSACYGDSGGPVYVAKEGQWFAIGATNGPDDVLTKARVCDEGAGRYASIGYYEEWIEKETGAKILNEKEIAVVPTDPTDPGNIVINPDPTDPTDPTDPGNIVINPDPTDPTDPGNIVINPDPTDPTDPGNITPIDPTDPGNVIIDPDPTDSGDVEPSDASESKYINVSNFKVYEHVLTVEGYLPKGTARMTIEGFEGSSRKILSEYIVTQSYKFSLRVNIPKDTKKTVSLAAYDSDGRILDSRFHFIK